MFFDVRPIRNDISLTFREVVCFENTSRNSGLGLKSRNYLNFYAMSVDS